MPTLTGLSSKSNVMIYFWKFFLILLMVVFGLVGISSILFHTLPYESFYLSKLDSWVKDHTPVSNPNTLVASIDEIVVPSCGKLVLVTAEYQELLSFLLWDRDEFYFRNDVCVRATVNRVSPQPEFENQKILDVFCTPQKTKFFTLMREHFGFCGVRSKTD